jgi:putative phosphoesterase
MWIGVISDTDGHLDPRALDVFSGVDYILHCGGIGHPDVIQALSFVAPVAGVLGYHDAASDYPFSHSLFRKWFEVGVYVTHALADPHELPDRVLRDLRESGAQVLLFGHAAEPFHARVDGRLLFCPGRAGGRRNRHGKSVGLLEIEGSTARAEVIPLHTA